MNIKIAGDFVINKNYSIDPNLIDVFSNSDVNIVNLEAPVTSSTSKIIKTGPHIKSDFETTKRALKELEVGLVTLANNHVLDYDVQGVIETLEFCKENNIDTVGAGKNLENACETYYIVSNGLKIGIVNFAENEWASATDKRAGAHPMDTIDNAIQIKKAKLKADYVFVIVHGGHEYYNLPSPRMQKQYRFYVDSGADLVVGHHTHCISGYEVYKEVPIYYSLGNFLFTSESKYEDWFTGLVLEVNIAEKGLSTKLHPVRQEKNGFRLRMLKDEQKNSVIERVNAYSEIIRSKAELNREWLNFVELKYNNYIYSWSPMSFIENRYIKGILRRLKFTGLNIRGIANYLNLMRCEAHADISKAVTEKYLYEK